MRSGDFGVEVVPVKGGEVREIDSGHVLARVGTVYGIRLRNHGPLRSVSHVTIDGKSVTAGGLVLDPYCTVTLERPVDDSETGRFTVVPEGDERVFGPDGGRDNPNLGLIEATFRRELPRGRSWEDDPRPLFQVPRLTPTPLENPSGPGRRHPAGPGRPMTPPEWTPPGWSVRENSAGPDFFASASAAMLSPTPAPAPSVPGLIERAAGTGLTGHSSQRFTPVSLGPLETEATTIRLRLVIGTEEAFSEPRPLPTPEEDVVPARPAARP
jgi:hypothetical protein